MQNYSSRLATQEILELYRHLVAYATQLFEQVMAGVGAEQTKAIAEKYEALLHSDQVNKGELQEAMQQRDAAQKRLQEQEQEIARLSSAEQQLERMNAEFSAANQAHMQQMNQLVAEMSETRKRYTAQIEHKEVRIAEVEASLWSAKAELQEKEIGLARLSDELSLLRQHYSELETKLSENAQATEQLLLQEREESAAAASLLRRKLKAAEAKRKELEEAQVKQAAAVKKAEKAIKNHLSYRLGSVLVSMGGNPLYWPILPFKLLAVRNKYAKQSKPKASVAQDKQGADLEALLTLYKQKGEEAAIANVRKETAKLTPKEQALALLEAGKYLYQSGVADGEMSFARAALALEDSEAIMRGFFWAVQRSGDLKHAYEIIKKIEGMLGPEPDAVGKKRLAQLHKQPAYQLSLIDKVPARTSRQIEPVKGRICYILHNSFPFSSGGYATRSHGLASGLAANGTDIIMITRPGFPLDVVEGIEPADVAPEEMIDNIPYTRILSPSVKGAVLVDYLLQAADALEEKFRELRPEYVVAASNYRVGVAALIAARRLGIPFMYEVRGWWEITRMSRDSDFEQTPAYLIQKQMESEVSMQADHVFTLTEPMREELIVRGVAPDNITIIPNSCDPARFLPRARDEELAAELGIPQNVTVIGYIGTFVDYEGLEDLAHACGVLKNRGVEFRLLLVGNENTSGTNRGPITQEILDAADQENFSDWLIMPGRVPHDVVERYYSLVDIAPFPRKPWPVCEMVSPMKPLEALAMEKAVVVSNVRALAEMIQDGKTGITFQKGDIESLADALMRLVSNPDLCHEMGCQGRRWVEAERTWKQTAKKLQDTLVQLQPYSGAP